ncbi:MAG: CPBP family intramembrane metalloprotease [Bacteriovoracaceae bacterium]|nr:CPBP family intramembrane metalloprotease [Bacteriovoracaceae bacterium]
MKKYLFEILPTELIEKDKRNSFLTFFFITFMMLLVEYYGWQGPFRHISRHIPIVRKDLGNYTFYSQVYTSLSFLFFFFIVPFLLNKLFPVKDMSSTGLEKFDLKKSFKMYSPLIILMLPILFFATSSPDFYRFYPLYKATSIKMFIIYELVYATQFVGIEYFFRGFGLFRLEKIMPGFSIGIMMIPYALVHIHKPFPEALGSIFAGLVLGKLALKTSSIWPGVITHIIIALSADIFSLYHSGNLTKIFIN